MVRGVHRPGLLTGRGSPGMALVVLRVAAGVGAAVHLAFFYLETVAWGPSFVRLAARAWIDPDEAPDATLAHIAWARPLAFNVGFYNAALAIGLAWTCISGPAMTVSLGLFTGLWLLIAAAAAGRTRVRGAFYVQGTLGLVILLAALLA